MGDRTDRKELARRVSDRIVKDTAAVEEIVEATLEEILDLLSHPA